MPGPAPVVPLLPHLADFAAERYGTRPFLLGSTPSGWRPLSFVDFAAAVRAFAAHLTAEGVAPGDRVGLQSENRPEWGIAYVGILAAGAVVVPLDQQLLAQEVGEILVTADAWGTIASAKLLPIAREAREKRRPGLRVISLDEACALPAPVRPAPASGEARLIGAGSPNSAGSPPAASNDLAVIIFTSGTTGQAKGVMLSHANLLHNVESVVQTIEVRSEDRLLSVLPLHHTFESTVGFLAPLRAGASIAYARSLKSSELREDLRTSDATLLLGVPLLYEKLLAAIERGIADAPPARRFVARILIAISRLMRRIAGLRLGGALLRGLRDASGLGRLRLLVCGAAALPEQVFWGFMDLGWPVLEGYGLTECSPVVAADSPHHPRPGAIGRPIVGVDVRIHEPDAEGHGEILVHGPNLMLGYYGNPAATAEVVKGGWLHTGDLGRLERDGRLRITGRLKNMIATAAGKKIYPEEIETHLGGCPYIVEVVVTGGRDTRGEREEVHAHVFPDLARLEELARATHATLDDAWIEATLKREIETRGLALAPYKRVKKVIVRKREFPKTATGKIQRLDIGSGGDASADASSESTRLDAPRVA